MDLKKITFEVCDLVKKTAKAIENESGEIGNLQVEAKGKHDYVTRMDKKSEELLVKGLKKIIPDSGFITEEKTIEIKGERYNWVIDPIDGTTNFMHGLPPYAISVALMEYDDIVSGVIYEMGFKECFYAWKNSKAYLNGKEISTSKTGKVSDSLLATGFPFRNMKHIDRILNSLQFFMENSHGVRRLGSAATDIAYTACGRFDGFYEHGLSSWDVAAGIIILQQAGGKISDFQGGTNYLFGDEFVASNPYMFDEFQNMIKKLMKGN